MWQPGPTNLAVGGVALTAKGDRLAISRYPDADWRKRVIQLWDATGDRPTATITDLPAYCNGQAFTPDGKTVLAWGVRVVKTWDAETLKEGPSLTGHVNVIKGLHSQHPRPAARS